jgi:hypothetical protein
MEDEQKDVPADSSSALGEAIASSPEALEETTPESQNPPAGTQGETQEEEAKIPYSRLKEVVDEKNWYKTQLEQRLAQQNQQQPQQPTAPQELGNTPEEREFWKAVDARADARAEQKFRQIAPVIDAGRMELAQMKVQQFRNAHPDIKSNSPEEIAIAERISSGYLPEDAYKVVMWDRKVAQAEKQGSINNKVKIEAKKQANVEQRSIPQGGTSPTGKGKLSQLERIKQEADKLDWS